MNFFHGSSYLLSAATVAHRAAAAQRHQQQPKLASAYFLTILQCTRYAFTSSRCRTYTTPESNFKPTRRLQSSTVYGTTGNPFSTLRRNFLVGGGFGGCCCKTGGGIALCAKVFRWLRPSPHWPSVADILKDFIH
ncbi:hypothetical protein LIA77_08370 [Sarocladium implicatum]|nr:hypothetical protein LIA77_08370 [Sarocladium implicatum]